MGFDFIKDQKDGVKPEQCVFDVEFTEEQRKRPWKAGMCTTGNSLDLSKANDDELEKMTCGPNGHAMVKEMEASAIAFVCHQYKVPFMMIKGITDHVEKKN